MKKLSFLVLLVSLLSACKKDGPELPEEGVVISSGSNGVYVANEGNFQFGNASVSYYADGMENAIEDLFHPANDRPLGDICQSMYLFNNKAYVVLNNSGKIEVVDQNSFISTDIIAGFNSPRYLLPVSNSKAYVTDLSADAISIVNLSANTIVGTIPCNGWTEQMALAYGKVFVTNQESNLLYVINTLNDVVTDSIDIGYGSNSIVEDKNGKLWVLCNGSASNNNNASIYRIDPVSNTVEESLSFASSSDSPWRLEINGSLDTLYFLNDGLYRMAISDGFIPGSPFIAENGRNFYGIGINPQNGNIYIADAIDYVQRGEVYIYSPQGELQTSFLAGIIPGEFYFN